MNEPDWIAIQRDRRRGLRGMAAGTAAFGAIVYLMIRLLNNDRTGHFIATACLTAVFLASVTLIAKRDFLTRERRSFLVTLAGWTGLIGLASIVAALIS